MNKESLYIIYYLPFKGSEIEIALLTVAHNKKEAKQMFNEVNHNKERVLVRIVRYAKLHTSIEISEYKELEK